MTPEERAREIVKTLGFAFDNAGGRRFVDEAVAEGDIAAAIREAVEAERREQLKHQERWQRLVNAIASAFTGGLVVGDDDVAVGNAILHVQEAGERLEAIEARATCTEPG